MSDWVAPGGDDAEPRVTTPEPAGHLEPPRGLAAPAELPPPPLPLRPMTISDLLDGSFTIMRRRPGDVLTIVLLLVVPVEVVSVLLVRDLLGAEGVAGFANPTNVLGSGDDEVTTGTAEDLLNLGISTISLVLVAGALAVLVDAWYRREHVSGGAAVAVALRRSWALVLAAAVVKVLEGVGLLALGLGALFAMALCQVASPAVTAERLGPFAAVGRSMALTRRRLGTSLLVPVLVGVVGLMVAAGFQSLPEVVIPLLGDDWHWLARGVGQVLSQLVVVPFTAGVAVLYHLDLRIRLEAHDIARRANELLPG